MSSHQEILRLKQKAGQDVYNSVLATLLSYDPAEKLSVGDIKYIARLAQNQAFDAFDQVWSA